jgi:hypothetical protein
MKRANGKKAAKSTLIRRHTELKVYKAAFDLSMQVFEFTKRFPRMGTNPQKWLLPK